MCVCRTSSGLVSGLRSCNHKCFDSSALINSEGSDSLPRLGRLDSNHHLKAGPPTVERVLGCAIRYMSYMYVMLTRNNCKVWLKSLISDVDGAMSDNVGVYLKSIYLAKRCLYEDVDPWPSRGGEVVASERASSLLGWRPQ